MKEEEPRQRRKEGRMKNGERSKHKAKSKGKHKDSRLGSWEAENVPLVSQQKQPAEGKGPMAKLQDESAIAIGLQVLLPYLLAGLGMVLAGMVLDYVQPPYAAIDGVPNLTGFEDTASLHCSWSSSLGTAKD